MYLIGYPDDSTALALGLIIEVGGQKKMTNREWINGLSNEQLVKLMRTFKEDSCEFCEYNGAAECGYCFDGQVAWLEQEHDDDSFEECDYHYCV